MPIRVLFVIGQLSVGGTERQLVLLVRHLDRATYEPMVVSLNEQSALSAELKAAECPVFVIRKGPALSRLVRCVKLARKIKPHLVHTFGFASKAGVPMAKALGVPVVVSVRTDPRRGLRLTERLMLRLADTVLANSKSTADALAGSMRLQKAPTVVYNGVEFDLFNSPRSLDPLPDEGDATIVTMVATLRPIKGVDVLLRAFAALSQGKTRLWIVGDGEARQDLERLTAHLGLVHLVRFLGMREDVPAVLARSDIGVISSHAEGLSNALIEYMAAGLPTVATRVGGNPELVVDGETGLLVPPADPNALAEALDILLTDKALALSMGAAGQNLARSLLSTEAMVQQTSEVYRAFLGVRK